MRIVTSLTAAALILCFGDKASAQGCGTQNPNCVVPTPSVGTNNDRAASTAFVQQNALNTSGLLVPFTESLTVSSNLATIAGYGFNPIAIGLLATDSASCTCPTPGQNIPTLLSVQENFGGSSINNGRIAASAFLNMTAATSPSNAYPFYVAQNAYAQSLVSDNGTGGSPRGVLEGNVSAYRLAGSATNWFAGVGFEILSDVESGASVARKVNLLLDNFAADTVQGTVVDTWIWTYGITSSVGKNTWAQIDGAGGVFALTSTGTVIKLVGSNTISTGFDFGGLTVSGNVLQWSSSSFSLAGNGNATLAAITATSLSVSTASVSTLTVTSLTTLASATASNLLFTSGTVSVGTCTGLGSGGTCSVNTGSTPQNGKITLTTGSSSVSAAGAFTLTFSAAIGTHDSSCRYQVQNGASAWAAGTTWLAQVSSTTNATAVWSNAGTSLSSSTNYMIEYQCFGM